MKHVYHVTYYRYLEGIDESGLVPGGGVGIGGVSLDSHRSGAIFFTEIAGLSFWTARAEEWAENRHDSPGEAGYVPVVLRVPAWVLNQCVEDDIGTDDANHQAWRCTVSVDPDQIEVFTGLGWVDIEDWGEVDPDMGIDEDGYYRLSSPLIPTNDSGRKSVSSLIAQALED